MQTLLTIFTELLQTIDAALVAIMCTLNTGCRPHGVWELAERIRSPQLVSALLQGVFTSPPHFRRHALVHGLGLLRKLLAPEPAPPDDGLVCYVTTS